MYTIKRLGISDKKLRHMWSTLKSMKIVEKKCILHLIKIEKE